MGRRPEPAGGWDWAFVLYTETGHAITLSGPAISGGCRAPTATALRASAVRHVRGRVLRR